MVLQNTWIPSSSRNQCWVEPNVSLPGQRRGLCVSRYPLRPEEHVALGGGKGFVVLSILSLSHSLTPLAPPCLLALRALCD